MSRYSHIQSDVKTTTCFSRFGSSPYSVNSNSHNYHSNFRAAYQYSAGTSDHLSQHCTSYNYIPGTFYQRQAQENSFSNNDYRFSYSNYSNSDAYKADFSLSSINSSLQSNIALSNLSLPPNYRHSIISETKRDPVTMLHPTTYRHNYERSQQIINSSADETTKVTNFSNSFVYESQNLSSKRNSPLSTVNQNRINQITVNREKLNQNYAIQNNSHQDLNQDYQIPTYVPSTPAKKASNDPTSMIDNIVAKYLTDSDSNMNQSQEQYSTNVPQTKSITSTNFFTLEHDEYLNNIANDIKNQDLEKNNLNEPKNQQATHDFQSTFNYNFSDYENKVEDDSENDQNSSVASLNQSPLKNYTQHYSKEEHVNEDSVILKDGNNKVIDLNEKLAKFRQTIRIVRKTEEDFGSFLKSDDGGKPNNEDEKETNDVKEMDSEPSLIFNDQQQKSPNDEL
ncbi:hypothetical protein TRFO_37010 [Tritrichomonas foetus]|uniref:Uncharacterized protein n=1 Tax=Tritrichomonas foetus TaxID=1144522 RepID=A0A1J4JC48_9EUKA|nr:hypothetical protein TRFO_37010 [Tritrichomonas foetus]|eukprot:OHS96758.1 hypothetical protein TRFO_37010 [Tritrichomonas foetus]